jgi:hypothetical protein
MRDDGPGGSSEPSVPADYAHLRIAFWRWWLRLVIVVVVGGMTVLHEMGLSTAMFWLGLGILFGIVLDSFVLRPAAVWLARVFGGRRRTG